MKRGGPTYEAQSGYGYEKKAKSVCRHFARGYCQLGESCKFAHEAQAQAQPQAQTGYQQPQAQQGYQQQAYAPQTGAQYGAYADPSYGNMASYDPYGAPAPSAFGEEPQYFQQQQAPMMGMGQMQMAPQMAPPGHEERTSGRARCRHWARGYCQMGGACNFSHTGAPGPDHTTPQAAQVSNFGSADCRHWIGKGYCSMGVQCNFSHAGVPGSGSGDSSNFKSGISTDRKRTEVCRHFARGNCSRGETCSFIHAAEAPAEAPTTVVTETPSAEPVAETPVQQ